MRTGLLFCAVFVSASWACGSSGTLASGYDGTGPGGGGASQSTASTDPGGGADTAADSGSSSTSSKSGGDRDGGQTATSDGGQSAIDSGGSNMCLPGVAPELVGKHNEGSNCMQGGCHDGSNGAPKWTVAGTLYNGVNSVVPVIGATIEVTDAKGKVVKIATSFDGNFHSTEPLTFPLSVRASDCPNDAHMLDHVTSTQGCNQSGCHESGMRMHLP